MYSYACLTTLHNLLHSSIADHLTSEPLPIRLCQPFETGRLSRAHMAQLPRPSLTSEVIGGDELTCQLVNMLPHELLHAGLPATSTDRSVVAYRI